MPLEDGAGSGVFEGLTIDGSTAFFSDLAGIYAQPLSGGARTKIADTGGTFRVNGDTVHYIEGTRKLRSVPTAGGTSTDIIEVSVEQNLLALGTSFAVSTNKLLGSSSDQGILYSISYSNGAAATLASFTSKLPPFPVVVAQDRIFFGSTPVDANSKVLSSLPISGGTPVPVALPAGSTFADVLGVVGDSVYVSAVDDFLKSQVFKLDSTGAIVASYTPSSGTPTTAAGVPGGVAIGGIQFLDVWQDGASTGERIRCFQVGDGVSSQYPTIHGYAASGSEVFLSIRTPEPSMNAIQRLSLP